MDKLQEYYLKISAMPTETKAQKARKAKAEYLLQKAVVYSGALGCIEELLGASLYSNKKAVAKQGEPDLYVKINKDGKVSHQKADRKTNGGRIGDILDGTSPSRYIIYSMDICNAGTSHKRRVVEPKIFSVARFLELLEECNALKNTNGKHPETAIQATSKSLYLAMLNEGIPYDPNTTYDYYALNE